MRSSSTTRIRCAAARRAFDPFDRFAACAAFDPFDPFDPFEPFEPFDGFDPLGPLGTFDPVLITTASAFRAQTQTTPARAGRDAAVR
jgi:hypothetical protein